MKNQSIIILERFTISCTNPRDGLFKSTFFTVPKAISHSFLHCFMSTEISFLEFTYLRGHNS